MSLALLIFLSISFNLAKYDFHLRNTYEKFFGQINIIKNIKEIFSRNIKNGYINLQVRNSLESELEREDNIPSYFGLAD